MQNQSAAQTGLSATELPKEERVRNEVIDEMNLVGVRPAEVGHERLTQLVPDLRIGNGRAEVGPVAVKDEPGTVPGHVQRDGLEVLGTVWLAAAVQERPELGPPQVDHLLMALHAVKTMPGEPGKLECDTVTLLVQLEPKECISLLMMPPSLWRRSSSL